MRWFATALQMIRRALPLLLLVLVSCSRERPVSYAGAPVVLISIDTLRADHLPAYGYRGVATPAIDALRRDSILYANAYSHCPMTLPSHVSILTGLLPYQHGVRNNIGYRFEPERHDSLPAILRRAGYTTGAAVSAYVLRGDTGLRPLFDFYDDQMIAAENASVGELWRPGSATADVAEQWIGAQTSKPFFLFFHIFEPHWPYEGSYDAEIATSDAITGRVIDRLKKLGVYDRAIVILLSDHGEGLGDHGESEHGVFLYREAIHVPLIVKLPRSERAGTTVSEPVQLIDVAPTVATLVAGGERGTPLLQPATGRRIYSETMLPRIHFGWSELRSLIDGQHHYIEAPRPELFDAVTDPRERTNVLAEQRRVYGEMREAMNQHASVLNAPAVAPEEAEKLAALGYIGQTRATEATNLPDPKDVIGDLEALKSAASLQREGRLREAAAAYEALALRNPRFADAWLRLAAVREELGQLDRTAEAYRNAIRAAPVLASGTALRLGSVFFRMGRLADAKAHAELALKDAPAAAHHLLGRIALAQRDLVAAEREARIAMSDPLYQGPGAVLLAQVKTAQGRLDEALRILDEARQTVGAIRDLEATRGDVLARLERAAEAETAFREEIRRYPQNIDAYGKLAFLYLALGRRTQAEATLRQLLKENPTEPAAALAAEVRNLSRQGSS